MHDDKKRRAAVERAACRYARAVRKARVTRADGATWQQTENYRLACERAELRTAQVKQVVYSMGTSEIHVVAYRNFGLHVDKLVRNYSGVTLSRLAIAAIDRWTAAGLRQDVLEAICRRVFNLYL